MPSAYRPFLVIAAAVVFASFGFRWFRSAVLDDGTGHGDFYIGVWTDPDGAPGNRLELDLVKMHEHSNWLIQAYNGVVKVKGLFGVNQHSVGEWGYETQDPLRLSLVFGDHHGSMAVRSISPNLMQVNFSKDSEELYVDDPFAVGELIRLHKVH